MVNLLGGSWIASLERTSPHRNGQNESMDFLEFMAKMKHGEFVSVQQDIFCSLGRSLRVELNRFFDFPWNSPAIHSARKPQSSGPELQEPLMVPWKKGSSRWTCRLGCFFFPTNIRFVPPESRNIINCRFIANPHKRVLNFDLKMTSMQKVYAHPKQTFLCFGQFRQFLERPATDYM